MDAINNRETAVPLSKATLSENEYAGWAARIMDVQRCATELQRLTTRTASQFEPPILASARRAHGLHAQPTVFLDMPTAQSWLECARDRITGDFFKRAFIPPEVLAGDQSALKEWGTNTISLDQRLLKVPKDRRVERLAGLRYEGADFDALKTRLANERDFVQGSATSESERATCKEVYFWADTVLHRLGTLARDLRLRFPIGSDEVANSDRYEPAGWFPKAMRPRLRMAAHSSRKSKRVRKESVQGVVRYSVADALRWWPQDMEPHLRKMSNAA